MAEIIRFGAVFKLDDPTQAEAWRIISQRPPRMRMAAICRMICGYQEQKDLLDAIRRLLREELQTVTISDAPNEKAGNVDEDILGFLHSLQEGDGFL